MPILKLESFDHWAAVDAPKKHWALSGNTTPSPGNGRNGTASLRTSSGSGTLGVGNPTLTRSGIAGFVHRTTALAGIAQTLFTVLESGTNHLAIVVEPTGAVRLQIPSGIIVTSTTTPYTGNTWHHVELAWTIDNAPNGSCELRIDGTVACAATGADTQYFGTGIWNSVELSTIGGTNDFDDLYVANDKTFRGDHRIVCVMPSVGNGAHTGWSPSAGGDHGAMVDEATPNVTDFVSSGSVGAIDTFNFPALGVEGTVAGLQISHYNKADVAGTRTIGNVIRIGGVDYVVNAPDQLGPDWDYNTFYFPISPATSGAWTVAEIDAAEFGVKVVG